MKRILLQAGHGGRTTGATGAPSEREWTTSVIPVLAQKLRNNGFEVKEIMADPSDSEIAGDWDLFLTLHYDSDSYNDRGGFVDIPDPSVDFAHQESKRIAQRIAEVYFTKTGIPEHPERSNANTKFYYMWKRMSEKTPCVILEAGVGFRVEEDWRTLHHNKPLVIDAIFEGILNAFADEAETDPCKIYKDENKKLKDQIIVLEKQIDVKDTKVQELQKKIDEHVCPVIPENGDNSEFVVNGKTETFEKDGKTVTINYAVER